MPFVRETGMKGYPPLTGPQSTIWHEVFWREPHLPCDLPSQAPPHKEELTADVTDFMEELHATPRHPNAVNKRMKAYCDHLAKPMRFQEEDQVWLQRLL
jgi:hypothetical protein